MAENGIGAELEIMPADDLVDVVAVGVGRVGVVYAVGDVSSILSEATVVCVSNQVDTGQNAITVAGEDVSEGKVRRPLPIADVVEDDVVRGVAEYKLVQQRGRESSIQPGDQADAWAFECGLDRWKTPSVRPEGDWNYRIPGIMDVAEGAAKLVREIVVHPDQFLSPVRRLNRGSNIAGIDATPAVRRRDFR